VSQHAAAIPSRGRYVNSGAGPTLLPLDIGHPEFMALVAPDTAYWSLVKRENLDDALCQGPILETYRANAARFAEEMHGLRFGLAPAAVYFNPTERCNLNCSYCYIPEDLRRNGAHMDRARLLLALAKLKDHFAATLPNTRKPQIIFHGSEPLLNREAMFAGIERYAEDFLFGVQTNATLLDAAAIDFLTSYGVGIGISLDGHTPEIANRTRATWNGAGVFDAVCAVMDQLHDYPGFSVLCTITTKNMAHLTDIVDFFHGRSVQTCMLNILRCTLPHAREVKPDDATAAEHYLAALERTHQLYRQTGRKLIVANFANALLGVVAPTARRLMCDISPCGGGRCFFALAANGDLFPCSEFIGLQEFAGGNIFEQPVAEALASRAFAAVTSRTVEDIALCKDCAIRHFCGSPCPAEAANMNGGMDRQGAFCEFYEEQIRYCLRLIADKRETDFLWDGWDEGVETVFDLRLA